MHMYLWTRTLKFWPYSVPQSSGVQSQHGPWWKASQRVPAEIDWPRIDAPICCEWDACVRNYQVCMSSNRWPGYNYPLCHRTYSDRHPRKWGSRFAEPGHEDSLWGHRMSWGSSWEHHPDYHWRSCCHRVGSSLPAHDMDNWQVSAYSLCPVDDVASLRRQRVDPEALYPARVQCRVQNVPD